MSRIVLDIETNSLVRPINIWCIVCKNIDTGELHVFRNLTGEDDTDRERFKLFVRRLGENGEENNQVIGHNILDFDLPVITNLIGVSFVCPVLDTLIVSRLENYSREGGHSLEAWGERFGIPKIKFNDFKQWSQELEDYCVRDVEISHHLHTHLGNFIKDCPAAVQLEHKFQLVVNDLHNKGFAFNVKKAEGLLEKVKGELDVLDTEIKQAFTPRLKPVRVVYPKITKYGTLNKSDFRWLRSDDLTEYNGGPFTRCSWVEFNPASHKQIVEVLFKAGWHPTDKTRTHIDADRNKDYEKLEHLKKYGWKINENNLMTLGPSAPAPARTLARRILLESRRRTLVEWLGLVEPETHRIHGKFYGIGAWTHRMAHQEPNTANIPNEFMENGKVKLYGKEMRGLWQAPRNRLLVGVDAEGIQLRVFAHYIDDPEFTKSLVEGKKDDKTDPHSLNKRVLGDVCKTRQAAKRFIYAYLLGAGLGKLAEVLECTTAAAKEALDRVLRRYRGFRYLKETQIPRDARRGYFIGLDGRKVLIPGEGLSERKHLTMSGYLQNGEAIVIKTAAVEFHSRLKEYNSFLVDIIHDEYQSEVPNDMKIALQVAQIQADAIKHAGEVLKLKCPMAGSYWNDDHKDYTIGKNWYQTH